MGKNKYIPERGERSKLVARLSEATMTTPATVYKWLSGRILPPPLKRRIVADMMGVPVEKLFPNDKKTKKH